MNDTLMNDPRACCLNQSWPAAPRCSLSTPTGCKIDSTLDYAVDGPSEFVFLIHAANGMNRWSTKICRLTRPRAFQDLLRRAIGQPFFALSGSARPLKVVYHALVDRDRACRCQCACASA
jgi:hypothetical protein